MPTSMGTKRRIATILGELAVIVVGVFIALAADAWNQERSARREGQDLLHLLGQELELNLEALNDIAVARRELRRLYSR